MRPLKILLVSGFFPPRAPVGAVRPGALVRYWRAAGHDVRIIAATPSAGNAAEDGVITDTAIGATYLPWTEPGSGVTEIVGRVRSAVRGAVPKSGAGGPGGPAARERPQTSAPELSDTRGLKTAYRQAVAFPDRYASWVPSAVAAGVEMGRAWSPDLVYSTGPPQSGHIAAAQVSAKLETPWVAELRDVWADNPYDQRHPFVRPFFNRLAWRTLGRADALVAVTQSAQAELAEHVRVPVVLSYNGFDAEDFDGLETVDPLDPNRLTLVFPGSIYPGRRDPTPLLEAMAMLDGGAQGVWCLFFDDPGGLIETKAVQLGVADGCEIRAPMPRRQILELERRADLLLDLRWANPKGDGVIPGKLFEYIGAGRQILSIGSQTGEAARIVRENNLGIATNDPGEIAEFLKAARIAKRATGLLPGPRQSADKRFERASQFARIDDLIASLVG